MQLPTSRYRAPEPRIRPTIHHALQVLCQIRHKISASGWHHVELARASWWTPRKTWAQANEVMNMYICIGFFLVGTHCCTNLSYEQYQGQKMKAKHQTSTSSTSKCWPVKWRFEKETVNSSLDRMGPKIYIYRTCQTKQWFELKGLKMNKNLSGLLGNSFTIPRLKPWAKAPSPIAASIRLFWFFRCLN